MIHKALLIATAVAALSACSGGTEETSAPNTQTATAEANTTAPPAAPAASNSPAANSVDTVGGEQFAQLTGDPIAGEKAFVQCKTCHVTDAGQNRIGPSLAGIVGRTAGTATGFSYSPANKNSGITWSKEKLFQYLENPQRVVPGTKMAFAGIQDPQKRADLIEWLATK